VGVGVDVEIVVGVGIGVDMDVDVGVGVFRQVHAEDRRTGSFVHCDAAHVRTVTVVWMTKKMGQAKPNTYI
jgi:tetrahydrodipicolinate N-succinyltransferase